MTRAMRQLSPNVPLTVGVLVLLAFLLTPPGLLADCLFLVGSATAVVLVWSGAPHAAPSARPAARLIALGVTSYSTGDLLFQLIVWAGGDRDPWVADVFYQSAYGLFAVAIFVLLMPMRGRTRVLDSEVVIDILTVVTVCVLVLWEFVVRDRLPEISSLAYLADHTAVLYPLVDGVLLGLVIRTTSHRAARRALGAGFGVGVVCYLIGDFAYLSPNTDAHFVTATSGLWLAGTLLVASSTRNLGGRGADSVRDDERRSGTAARLMLAIFPLSVPPLLVIIETAVGRDPESWSLVVGIMVLISLAFLRTERLLASERTIRLELAVARDAALEASRAKSTFLASISHEIRTPMNGVLGLSRLLDATDLDEHQRQYTRGIASAGESLMVLLNDVLDFAKFDNGKIHVEAVDFDVVELVEDVAAMVAEQAHHQGIELLAHCAVDLPRALHGDPTKLRQVLLNFAANAVKFTSEGEVVIRAELVSSQADELVVRLQVTDTGPGIAKGDQQRLFKAFSQLDPSGRSGPTTTRTYGGTGLGLAIVHALVTAMGGEVGVRSSPGRGSTFWCTLPLAPARRQQLIATRPSRARPGTRVLVVDDNASHRVILHEQLAAWGLYVDVASGAETALRTLRAARAAGVPYALAVIDLRMPRMDGRELARLIDADPDLSATRMLMMSSGPEVPASDLSEAGVEVTIPKPVQVSRLQGAVQRALGPTTDQLSEIAVEPVPMGRGVVLVVEDSEVNQMVAVGTLRQLGYLTEVAKNGLEAVEMVRTTNYDVVLMDCRMPVMDGYEAAAEIRRLSDLSHSRVPIVAVTASAVPGDRERCLQAGMDDYLVKPLGRQQLADALTRWVVAPARQAQ